MRPAEKPPQPQKLRNALRKRKRKKKKRKPNRINVLSKQDFSNKKKRCLPSLHRTCHSRGKSRSA